VHKYEAQACFRQEVRGGEDRPVTRPLGVPIATPKGYRFVPSFCQMWPLLGWDSSQFHCDYPSAGLAGEGPLHLCLAVRVARIGAKTTTFDNSARNGDFTPRTGSPIAPVSIP
jgi:hypothetical protein